MSALQTDENLAYHAARVLLLITLCGTPRGKQAKTLPGIEGRTLLAKLDFFLRYPVYLKKAAQILNSTSEISNQDLGLSTEDEIHSVESKMVRYLYGPWDNLYYIVLAYLIGKELIQVEKKQGTEIFRLTVKGNATVSELVSDPMYADLIHRANTVYKLFHKYKGYRLKEFIYKNFPEVVNREIGAVI
ncbi:MAG: hypothetical protein Kow00121_64420 [Elainellaceae cyanobacterium]